MKSIIVVLTVSIILFFSLYSGAQPSSSPVFTVTGVVTSVNHDQLKITERVDAGVLRLYMFVIDGQTTITGRIREGSWVTVAYTRIKRWHGFLMTALDISVLH